MRTRLGMDAEIETEPVEVDPGCPELPRWLSWLSRQSRLRLPPR